jgi:hypothetical protein
MTKGLGAFYKEEWFCIPWNQWNPWYKDSEITSNRMHINFLELLALILCCIAWGKEWTGTHVLAHCDNESVCKVIFKKSSRDEIMNHLLMILHYVQIHYGFQLTVEHINTEDNINADVISRYEFTRFFNRNPTATIIGRTIKWSEIPQFQTNKSFLLLPTKDQASLTVPQAALPNLEHSG